MVPWNEALSMVKKDTTVAKVSFCFLKVMFVLSDECNKKKLEMKPHMSSTEIESVVFVS